VARLADVARGVRLRAGARERQAQARRARRQGDRGRARPLRRAAL